jgi:hypothetical protein
VSAVAALLLLAGCGGGGSSSNQPAAASDGAGGGTSSHHHRHHQHHHRHQKELSGGNGGGKRGGTKSETAGGGANAEKPAPSEDKQEREVDRLIKEAESSSGIGNDMPGLDYSMVQQGWSHGEAEAFTKLMSAAGLSEKSAESVAAAVLVSEEQGASHREAVAAGLEIYGALGGLGE